MVMPPTWTQRALQSVVCRTKFPYPASTWRNANIGAPDPVTLSRFFFYSTESVSLFLLISLSMKHSKYLTKRTGSVADEEQWKPMNKKSATEPFSQPM
jgi:hypothetical protein